MADSGKQERGNRERLRVLDLSAVGLAFPVALLFGYFAGRYLGGLVGAAQLGSMIGALFGIVGGFYNLFKMINRLAPRSTTSNSSTVAGSPEEHGDDP